MWCLGHARSSRFNGECTFNLPRFDAASLSAMQKGAFYAHWFASCSDYVKMHWAWTLPLFYLLGLLYVPLKMALNPPCLSRLLHTLHFEVDAPFPGSSPAERLTFAKRWYSTAPRQPPFDGWRVPARFTHLPDRCMWMERIALFKWLVLPAQCGMARFDAALSQWHIYFPLWGPHLLVGWVIVGENPDGTGWLITGEFKCWLPLAPLYKWLIVRALEGYGDTIVAAQPEKSKGPALL